MNSAIDQPTRDAVTPVSDRVRIPFAVIGPVLEVDFVTGGDARDIPHGLGAVPDGYMVLLCQGGPVGAVDYSTWTDRVAWMEAPTETKIRIVFYTLQAGVIRHVVPS